MSNTLWLSCDCCINWKAHATFGSVEGRQQQYTTELESLASEAISWTTTEEWVVELSRPLRHLPRAMTPEEEAFWPAYFWAKNPWTVDLQENVLTSRQYAKIQPCTIAELRLRRIENRTYSFVIPTVGATSYQQAKLRRWGLAILLSAPSLAVGQELQVRQDILLRHPPKLTQDYTWEYTTPGCVSGIMVNSDPGRQSVIALEQDSNGIHWSIAANNIEDQRTAADCQRLRKGQVARGIVFYANPLIHGFPWSVPDTIANKHVLLALKKQPFRWYKGLDSALTQTLETLQDSAEGSAWQTAALQQTPTSLWAHRNELTAYQVWVVYRVAARQMNLSHPDRGQDNSCL